jgi:pimeloyl-ACP methyl ester carboxylesterase
MSDASSTAAPARRILRVNGLDMAVEVAGAGPDVLLLHGFPDTGALWRRQVPALTQAGFRVIVPDLRGCGETTIPSGGSSSYRMETLVADVLALLDALEVEKARLVGHDWGSAIGWMFAISHAQRVERYVAVSVGHPLAYLHSGLRQKLMAWYMVAFQARGAAEWLLSRNDFARLGAASGYPEELPNWRAALSRPGRLTAALNYYRGNLDLFRKVVRGDVTVPVMGVWSSRDVALVEAQMTGSARYCKAGLRYERIENVSHWIPLEAPDRLNPLLIDFLRA